jgi:uncharacterized coiled-coil DUF342 family protein
LTDQRDDLNDKFIKSTTDVQNLKVEREKMKNRIIRIKNRKGKVDLG